MGSSSMPVTEIYLALKTGTIDATDSPLPVTRATKVEEIIKQVAIMRGDGLVFESANDPARSANVCPMRQIRKLTMRNMMRLPTPIQQAASPSPILVMLSCQTLP